MVTDQSRKILVVEDDEAIRCSMVAFLEDHGFAVLQAQNGRLGLELFHEQKPELILLDLRMPEVDGLQVLATVVRESPDTPVIVVSGAGPIANVVEALHLGAWDYVAKPLDDMSVILLAIERSLERAELIKNERGYQHRLEREVQRRTAEIRAVNEKLEREIEERRRAEELLRKQRNLAAALAATFSLQEGLRLCLDTAIRVSQMDCGGVFLFDSKTGVAELTYHQGISPAFVQAVSDQDSLPAYSQLFANQQPFYAHVRELPAPLGQAERQEGLQALASLPFRHQDRVIGRLNLGSHTIEEIPQFCRPALEAIASQMGSAVARLTAEADLRESESRFRTLFDSAPIALGVGTRDGRVLASNEVAHRLLGYARADIGEGDLAHIYADPADRARLLVQLQTNGVAHDRDVLLKRQDGTVFHASVTLVPFTFEGQDCHLSAFEDVSEQRRAEEELRSLAQRLAIHVEHTPLGVIEWDIDFCVTQWNRAAERIFGYTAQEALGRYGPDLIVPESARAQVGKVWQNLVVGEGGTFSVNENVTKTGETRICEWQNTTLVDANGVIIGVAALVQDITDRKRAQEALRESETRYRLLFDNTPALVSMYDQDGVCVLMNRTVASLFGGQPRDFIGQSFSELHPEAGAEYASRIREVILTERPIVCEDLVRFPEGDRWLESDIRPVRNASGKVIAAQILSRDVTADRQAEADRKAHIWFLESLERVNQALRRQADIDEVMGEALQVILSIFDADRAWLLYPCDPSAPAWRVHLERTRPEYPCRPPDDTSCAMTPSVAGFWHRLLTTGEPCTLSEDADPPDWDPQDTYQVQSALGVALWPRVGKPWVLGLHQCSRRRVWPPEERRLFQEVGRRLEDALGNLLATRDLSESAARLRAVVDQADDELFLVSLDGDIVDVNQCAVDNLGYTREELLSMTIADIDVEAESQRHKERFWDSLTLGTSVTFEGTQRRRDGTTFPVEVRAGLVEFAGERLLLGLVRDVTERKRAERERNRMFELSIDMLCIAGFDGYFKQLNPAYTTTLGWTPEELRSLPWLEFVHPDDREATVAAGAQLAAGKPVRSFENRYRCKDGSYRWISWNSLPLPEEQEIFAVARDITELKHAAHIQRASERSYREIFNATNEMVFVHDARTGAIKDANQATVNQMGYSRKEILGRTVGDLSLGHPPFAQEDAERLVRQAAEQGGVTCEWLAKRKDGELFWVEINLKPAVIGDEDCVLCVARDITERKRAEEALHRSEERFRQIAENAQEWIWDVDVTGLYTYASPVVETILGYRPEELVGRLRFFDLLHPDDREEIKQQAFQLFSQKRPIRSFPNRNLHKSGREVWLLTTGIPILDENGELSGYRGADTDITERRLADEERQAHLQFLESLERIDTALRGATDLQQALDDAVAVIFSTLGCDRAWMLYPCDPDAPSFRVPVEHTRPEYIGAHALDLELPMLPGTAQDMRVALASDGPVLNIQGGDSSMSNEVAGQFGVRSQMFLAIRPGIGKPWLCGVHQCSHARVWTRSERRLFQEMGRRISDALNSLLLLRELRDSEQKYRDLVETSTYGVIIHQDRTIVYVNPALVRLLGYASADELLHRQITDLLPESRRAFAVANIRDIQSTGKPVPLNEVTIFGKDGHLVDVEVTAVRVSFEGKPAVQSIVSDIRERKRAKEALARLNEELEQKVRERTRELEEAQEQLLRKEKLAVLGQLAGGVSHEIRNPLGVIKNAIYYLRLTQQDLSDKGQQHLGLIEREVNTANRIITELLDYAREPRTQPGTMVLLECLERALVVAAPPAEVQVRRQFSDAPATAWADEGQVEQILVNLLRNAVQAMPEGGELTLHCYAHAHRAIIKVADTGVGIAPENMAKVLEPLYTNKAKGIGLGLAISRQYAELNGGDLQLVQSELGRGSVFQLTLPLGKPVQQPEKGSKP